jgi:hypothetical protein
VEKVPVDLQAEVVIGGAWIACIAPSRSQQMRRGGESTVWKWGSEDDHVPYSRYPGWYFQ